MAKTNREKLAELTEDEQKKVFRAAEIYLDRQDRRMHPEGEFDKRGRWYPDSDERCDCCAGVRSPSAAWPNSLNKHCRSVEHVANLRGVDVSMLRAAAKVVQEQREEARQERGNAPIM